METKDKKNDKNKPQLSFWFKEYLQKKINLLTNTQQQNVITKYINRKKNEILNQGGHYLLKIPDPISVIDHGKYFFILKISNLISVMIVMKMMKMMEIMMI